MKKLRIVIVTSDKREHDHNYSNSVPAFGTAPEALLSGFSFMSEVEIEIISCLQKRFFSVNRLSENIRYYGLFVPKAGWLRGLYSGCINAVQSKINDLKPDIIHAQGTERECAVSSVFSRRKKILTIHGNCRAIAQLRRSRPFSYWWLQARLERFCLPRFDGVVCISSYTKNWVSGLAKKSWLLPNAVDSKFFEIQPKATGRIPIILVVANVDARKNQIGLIQALDALSGEGNFQVKFFGKCGEDSYGTEFRALVHAKPWCVWGGMLDRDRLRDEFAKASVVMLPTWEDNCPMVVLEAQAAGVPVIASNVGGVPDLVQDGRTGLLTDPKRPETMSKALARLLGDPQLARRLAQEGRSQAKARFHPKVIAEKHLEIYREVIASR